MVNGVQRGRERRLDAGRSVLPLVMVLPMSCARTAVLGSLTRLGLQRCQAARAGRLCEATTQLSQELCLRATRAGSRALQRVRNLLGDLFEFGGILLE